MSLHFLGIRDFPILHQQLRSPTTQALHSRDATEDITHDSKDVLIQRLLDLATHLQSQDLRDGDVSLLHRDADSMERTLRQSPVLRQQSSFQSFTSVGSGVSRGGEDERFWQPLSPSMKSPGRMFGVSRAPSRAGPVGGLSATKSALLAEEAEALLVQLTKTVSELKERREESEHIHDLLVVRAEKAAQRVIELEDHVSELDADYESTESELNFLRVQLRALEVQGLDYVQFNDDEELTQSIINWKQQWADVEQRTKARRRKIKSEMSKTSTGTGTLTPTPTPMPTIGSQGGLGLSL
ncbi:hypothetical protein V499_09280 [Pseudogymnoascus sp. VKM F-103]|nr:hypothetical protein V499_09280 [Pseudogymnoascus sp. VKM F-103]